MAKSKRGKAAPRGRAAAAAAARQRRLTSVKQLDFMPAGRVFPSPADWRDQVLYELMIDRFDDGKRHRAYDPKRAKRGRDAEQGRRFQGGRIKGITRRLDYLRGLGVTALWVTSPLRNRLDDPTTYHGYGAQDFLSVDPRFGTTEDLRALVDAAHDRGMYVLLDIVIDHAGDVWAYEDDEKKVWHGGKRFPFGFWREGAISPTELRSPDAFKRKGRMTDPGKSHGAEATDADFMEMKALDLENPAVLSTMIAIFKHWIATTDIDGFRIDAFRHIRPDAAADFCNAIREFATRIGKKNFLQIGEVAGDQAMMLKYVGSNAPLPGEHGVARYPLLDAVLDFELFGLLLNVILGRANPRPLIDHFEFLSRYWRDTARAGRNYVTFFENHDRGAVQSGSSGGVTGRLLHIEKDPRLAVLASAFILTSIGIPCLYYGTEQGFDGGGEDDRYVRECMFGGKWGAFDTTGMAFFNPKHPLYQQIAKLTKVRSETPALRCGRQYFREISGDGEHFGYPHSGDGHCTLAYSRILDTSEVLVALNLDRDARNDAITVDEKLSPPKSKMIDLLGGGRGVRVQATPDGRSYVRLKLPGRGVAVLSNGR